MLQLQEQGERKRLAEMLSGSLPVGRQDDLLEGMHLVATETQEQNLDKPLLNKLKRGMLPFFMLNHICINYIVRN